MNGGVMVFSFGGKDVSVAVVNPAINTLLVLNIHPEHRGHGLGSALLWYLQCNFARVLESAIPFFERNGYQVVGSLKQGKSLSALFCRSLRYCGLRLRAISFSMGTVM